MKLNGIFAAGATAMVILATPLWAGDIVVKDAYLRSTTPNSKTGAAFLMLMNKADEDDRLVAASTDIAGRVELHTHMQDANGVMKMMEVEEGFSVPAGGMHHLERGGDHIMLMGLTKSLEQGEEVTLTLTFEKAGDIEITLPVDRERKAAHGHGDHGHKKHGEDDHSDHSDHNHDS